MSTDSSNNEIIATPSSEIFNNCEITDKQDTIVIDQGVEATGEVILTDRDGNPINLFDYFIIDCSDRDRYQNGSFIDTTPIQLTPEEQQRYQNGQFTITRAIKVNP